MASHLSDLGFSAQGREEIIALVMQAVEEGEPRPAAPHGEYIVWAPGAGIQLWVQVLKGDIVVDYNPHFAGITRVAIEVEDLTYDQENPLNGFLSGWVNATEGEPMTGTYPIVAHQPDFALFHPRRELPAIFPFQVTAFAELVQCYPDEAAFAADQTGELKFAPESFITLNGPHSFLTEAEAAEADFAERALMGGHIRQATLLTNPVTRARFYHLVITVQEAEFDVVADPELFNLPPVEGGIIHGTFWLSARAVAE